MGRNIKIINGKCRIGSENHRNVQPPTVQPLLAICGLHSFRPPPIPRIHKAQRTDKGRHHPCNNNCVFSTTTPISNTASSRQPDCCNPSSTGSKHKSSSANTESGDEFQSSTVGQGKRHRTTGMFAITLKAWKHPNLEWPAANSQCQPADRTGRSTFHISDKAATLPHTSHPYKTPASATTDVSPPRPSQLRAVQTNGESPVRHPRNPKHDRPHTLPFPELPSPETNQTGWQKAGSLLPVARHMRFKAKTWKTGQAGENELNLSVV